MNAQSTRVFKDEPAARVATPMFIGLFGPTGSGKTYSALRLATGIQRVVGGDIFAADSESNRMRHYAPKKGHTGPLEPGTFAFKHIPFEAPFSPLDYIGVIDHCAKRGARTIIIDSASHEHEGQGGVLEWHAEETQRLAKQWNTSPERAQLAAWGPPKQARRKLIARILQINANVIFCFRAREKLKIVKGRDPVELGWQPIGGEELFFEMTLSCLLQPMAKGVPTWQSKIPGEKQMMKLPAQFVDLFGTPKQLDEDTGEQLARWAAGGEVAKQPAVRATAKAPPADPATWATTLAAQEKLSELETAWESCTDAFAGLVPDECDFAYKNRREELQQ